jgi:hypothetical protein
MAYQIKRKNRVVEKLELCNADGSVALAVDVDINVDDIGGKIAAAQKALVAAQEQVSKDSKSDEAKEAFGSAVISLFIVLFGEEDTERILAFYDGRYTEMFVDVFPFIDDVVMPRVREASESRKEQLLNMARASKRSARKGFFR